MNKKTETQEVQSNLRGSNIAEVQLHYKTKGDKGVRICSSTDISDLLKTVYNPLTIAMQESFYVILLNRQNSVIGVSKISDGGVSGTVAEVRYICALAVLSLASGVIVSHNHPSGNVRPSGQDLELTRKVKAALKLFDVVLLDHVIMTPDNEYYSMADCGDI